jgi:hypothetical protein
MIKGAFYLFIVCLAIALGLEVFLIAGWLAWCVNYSKKSDWTLPPGKWKDPCYPERGPEI